MRGSGRRKKPSSQLAQLVWVDSDLRFVARLSNAGDQGVLLRMDVRRPTAAQAGKLGVDTALAAAEDDLYLNVGEMLLLRPYEPRQSMRVLAAAASPHEVTVRVEAFWSGHESGGNHGRAVRSGSVLVVGETEALSRLRGDHHEPRPHSAPGRVRDASGVCGAAHALVGGITLRRVRNAEAAAGVVFAARWICVDYTATHARYCTAVPRCTGRSSLHSTSSACALREGLTLRWQTRNEHDENAIEVLAPMPDGAAAVVVGFVPRELAACLSPSLRRGCVRVSGVGVHSAPAAPCAPPSAAVSGAATVRYRVWFKVCPVAGVHDDAELAAALARAPWWVDSDANRA